jgi:hypothetical protein
MSRTFLTAVVAGFIALSVLADDAAPARFFIERIEVRNAHRVSSDLVISESLLREGAEYSEQDLRAASSRLSRLPFLVSADFALEKGSERGRHVLVINIAETKPFFFLIDARPIINDEGRQTLVDYAGHLGAESNDAAVGVRMFVGPRGVVHAGLTSRRDAQEFTTDYSALAVGYTQYDLFGTRAFATVNVRYPFDTAPEGSTSPQLVVGIPLTANQTLTFDYEEIRFRRGAAHVSGLTLTRQDAERLISATWTYNTTDQPFVPTRGTIIRVAPLWAMRDLASYSFTQFVPGPSKPPEAYAQHVNGHGIDVLASHYWELTERHAVSAGIQAGWASVDDRVNRFLLPADLHSHPTYEVLRGGYSRNLWDGEQKNGDSRLELDVRYVLRQHGFDRDRSFRSVIDDDSLQPTVSWVRRSSWGTLRLGLGFAWRK